jgi:transcription initiation factor TFIIIB Brf1 subunit/transcription initiation factor TFIIB
MPYIISADMHMSYCEEELDKMMKDQDIQRVVKEINTEKSRRNYLLRKPQRKILKIF